MTDNEHEPNDIDTLKCQILMKEIDNRSAEINARIPSQMQTIASLAVLTGGFVALAGFLFGPSHVISFIPWGPVIGLIYSFIVLTFAWTNLDHDVQMADIGNYLDDVVRPQLCEILGTNQPQDKNFFSWGYYRTHKSIRLLYTHNTGKGWRGCWNNLSSLISGASRYGFMFVLAGITLVMAILITVTQWSSNQWGDIIHIFGLNVPWLRILIVLSSIGIFIYGLSAFLFATGFFRKFVREEKARIFGLPKLPE